MKMILTSLLVSVFTLITICVKAQSITPSTINSAGGTAIVGGNEYDYSVAEMTMVSTFTTPSVIITQGVLQPADTAATTPESVTKSTIANNLLIFPNPASTMLNLQFTSSAEGTFGYRLMDLTGKEIMSKTTDIKQGITLEQLNIDGLAAATYMLEAVFKTPGNKEQRVSYKIEKIK